jgi:hypothetical protein
MAKLCLQEVKSQIESESHTSRPTFLPRISVTDDLTLGLRIWSEQPPTDSTGGPRTSGIIPELELAMARGLLPPTSDLREQVRENQEAVTCRVTKTLLFRHDLIELKIVRRHFERYITGQDG